MKRVALAAAAALSMAGARADAAGSALLGGFQPVAVEEGGRAAWICPAAISYGGASQLLVEGVFVEDEDGGHGELSYLTLAAATDRRAYGWHLELDDVAGVPDWTLVAAQVLGQRRGPRLGSAIEWRGGEENRFDATLGLIAPVGRHLRAAVAAEDIFRADVDGASSERSWRAGAAARGRAGWLSWDWRAQEGARGRHFFGVGLDLPWTRVSGAVDDEGGYVVALRVTVDERSAGAGFAEPDRGPGHRFATVELGGAARRVR
jgi:hypothetical protein